VAMRRRVGLRLTSEGCSDILMLIQDRLNWLQAIERWMYVDKLIE
jgi:hypothetical protein